MITRELNTNNTLAHHKLLTYGLNKDNSLVYIEDVPNGLACECICPCCKEPLIARNKGKYRKKHFAHSSGCDCSGYYETTIHLLSKEIIKTEKSIMLPEYEYLEPQQLVFEEVEVEERNDCSNLQPDCVGITKEGMRLHIEICVTHQIDDYKKSKIKEGNINCIEIRIPSDFPLDKELLKEFMLNNTESREWINYPHGEMLYSERKKAEIKVFREQYPESRAIRAEKCKNCKIHFETIHKQYNDFIYSYINRIHPWAKQIALMSPQDIVNQDLSLRYSQNTPYIWFNNWDYWIFPRVGEHVTKDQMTICESTYDFFKHFYNLCKEYIDVSIPQHCPYYKAYVEYKSQGYVFCDYKQSSIQQNSLPNSSVLPSEKKQLYKKAQQLRIQFLW